MLLKVLKNTLLFLTLTTFCRLVFYVLNFEYFSDFDIGVFFYGLRFDFVSISYLFSGFYICLIIPLVNRCSKGFFIVKTIFFQLGLNLMLVANFIDSVYYNFTFQRSTGDVFNLIGAGNDVVRLIPQFLKDFWYMLVLYAISVFLFTKAYELINKGLVLSSSFYKQIIGFICGVGVLIVGARGGFQLRPLNMADAPRYASGSNVAVLLNTPFSILLTFQNPGEGKVSYFSKTELEKTYSPKQKIYPRGGFEGRNVVLIILESFGEEYVGYLSGKESYTPFLDSLLTESYVFRNNRANGLKSIEALPSLFAGLPSLNNSPFILSPYSSDAIDALPIILKEKGYSTSFYHAGETGTMAFDAFCKNAGIQNYYGLEDYPKSDEHFDGNWGIFDEHYLKYFGVELNNKNEPFFSSIFTLSSHHPYSIPLDHIGKFKKGRLKVHETIGYTDYSLRQFFKTVEKSDWYKNTLFVITADHPAQSEYLFYKKNVGRYKVPLAFFDPSGILKGESFKPSKHADIPSTVLSLLGDSSNVLNFGVDLFSEDPTMVINFKNSSYIIRNHYLSLVFDGKVLNEVYLATDSLWENNVIKDNRYKPKVDSLLNLGKAYLQQYKNRLIENRLIIGR